MLRYINDSFSEFALNIGIRASPNVVFDSWTTADDLMSIGLTHAEFKNDPSGCCKTEESEAKADHFIFYTSLWDCDCTWAVNSYKLNEYIGFSLGEHGSLHVSFEVDDGITIVTLRHSDISDEETLGQDSFQYWIQFWMIYLVNLKTLLEQGIRIKDYEPNHLIFNQNLPDLKMFRSSQGESPIKASQVDFHINKTEIYQAPTNVVFSSFSHLVDLERWLFHKVWISNYDELQEDNTEIKKGDEFFWLINLCYDVMSSAEVVEFEENQKVSFLLRGILLLEVELSEWKEGGTKMDYSLHIESEDLKNSFDLTYCSIAASFWAFRLKGFLEHNIDINLQEVLNPRKLNFIALRA